MVLSFSLLGGGDLLCSVVLGVVVESVIAVN